jgi:hypothetical protein
MNAHTHFLKVWGIPVLLGLAVPVLVGARFWLVPRK